MDSYHPGYTNLHLRFNLVLGVEERGSNRVSWEWNFVLFIRRGPNCGTVEGGGGVHDRRVMGRVV